MESPACRGLGRVSISSTTVEAPVCTAAVGLVVGIIDGAGEADWPWREACGFEAGFAPWPVEDEEGLAGLAEVTGAWLAVCGVDVGTVL